MNILRTIREIYTQIGEIILENLEKKKDDEKKEKMIQKLKEKQEEEEKKLTDLGNESILIRAFIRKKRKTFLREEDMKKRLDPEFQKLRQRAKELELSIPELRGSALQEARREIQKVEAAMSGKEITEEEIAKGEKKTEGLEHHLVEKEYRSIKQARKRYKHGVMRAAWAEGGKWKRDTERLLKPVAEKRTLIHKEKMKEGKERKRRSQIRTEKFSHLDHPDEISITAKAIGEERKVAGQEKEIVEIEKAWRSDGTEKKRRKQMKKEYLIKQRLIKIAGNGDNAEGYLVKKKNKTAVLNAAIFEKIRTGQYIESINQKESYEPDRYTLTDEEEDAYARWKQEQKGIPNPQKKKMGIKPPSKKEEDPRKLARRKAQFQKLREIAVRQEKYLGKKIPLHLRQNQG